MNKKAILLLLPLSLLAVSCGLFGSTNAGILKTGNGGIDWQQSSQLKDSDQTLARTAISKLVADPKLFGVLYAGTFGRGLLVSRDGGAKWEELLGKVTIMDFVIHPDDSNIIFAAGIFGENGKVFGTRDGGKSWTEVFSSAEVGNSVRAIAINPANPNSILIGLSNGPLIRSDDGGTAWRLVNNYSDRINQIIWNNEAVYVVVRTTGVLKSTDGGNTFQSVTSSLASINGSTNNVYSSSVAVYNQLSVSRSSPNVQYLTTDLGLYRSTDGGANWSAVSMPLRQQGVTMYAVAIAPSSPGVVYVGAGSQIFKTLDEGNSWLTSDSKTGNSINTILVNPDSPQVAYAGIYLPQ